MFDAKLEFFLERFFRVEQKEAILLLVRRTVVVVIVVAARERRRRKRRRHCVSCARKRSYLMRQNSSELEKVFRMNTCAH